MYHIHMYNIMSYDIMKYNLFWLSEAYQDRFGTCKKHTLISKTCMWTRDRRDPLANSIKQIQLGAAKQAAEIEG